MNNWIEVNGAEELPPGTWLVEVDCPVNSKRRFHVAEAHPNMTTVGNHFHWDMPRVIRYKAIEES
jgi:hypothetical protein